MKVEITVTTDDGASYTGDAVLSRTAETRTSRATPKPAKEVRAMVVRKPAEAIGTLYQHGFFKTPKTLGEAMSELARAEYNFAKSSVATALGNAGYLQMRGTKGSYRFIQKYPPAKSPKSF